MLVVRRDDKETMVGAIHLPSQDVDAPTTGTVIAAGPQVYFKGLPTPKSGSIASECIIGSRVAFTKYGGVEWDEQHVILRQEDIMCFIEDE